MRRKQTKRRANRCEVSWQMDHQCYEPAIALAYPKTLLVQPFAVCDEHAEQAKRSGWRVEPINALAGEGQ